MKRISLCALVLWSSRRLRLGAVALLLVFVGQASFAKEYLVKYRTSSGWTSLVDTEGMRMLDQHNEGHLLKVDITEANKLQTLLKLYSHPSVEYVVPNFKLRKYLQPVNLNAQALRNQWAISKVKAEEAWKRAGNKGSRSITVAVIDTGMDYNHQALAPNAVPGYNFKNNNNDPMDKTSFQNPGHGTHCAGIIGATGLIDGGIIGISPEVSLMPLRFLDENGSGDLMDGIKAIDYAISKNVNVISASWGAPVKRAEAQPLIEAVERAGKANIPFVVAAANDGKNNDKNEYYPTNSGTDNTIAVSATDSSDAKPSWSNYGRAKVDIGAPGAAIMSTLPGNKYGNLDGTSMATPLVAGLVAFLKAQDNTLTPLQLRSLIQASGDKMAIEVACDCRINALNAVEMLLTKKMYVSPWAETIEKGATLKFEAVWGQAPFSFAVSNSSVASIDASGTLTGLSEGETTVSVKDARGQTATSYKIYVGAPASNNPPNPPPGGPTDPTQPPGMDECPLDPQTCQLLCQLQPDLPFCKN